MLRLGCAKGLELRVEISVVGAQAHSIFRVDESKLAAFDQLEAIDDLLRQKHSVGVTDPAYFELHTVVITHVITTVQARLAPILREDASGHRPQPPARR